MRELRAALERSGENDPLRRARLLAMLALELTYAAPLGERRRLSDDAVALARDDPATLAAVLWARHAVLWVPEFWTSTVRTRPRFRDSRTGSAIQWSHSGRAATPC